jgi:hypothetical protein
MKIRTWNIEAMTGYKPITTFYEDFSIADHFGKAAVKDTFRRAFETAIFMGYKELTEFVMALNWKIWEHYGHNEDLARLYNDLWEKADLYAQENLKGEELSYFYRTTD